MKDYSRKNYSDHQYRDWMKTVTSKSVFNQVLENTTGLGEFSNNKATKTSLGRAVARFLKQSEFKKPQRNLDFKDMEEDWEYPGYFRPGFDQPWNMQQPWLPAGEEELAPVTAIFDAESDSEYCPGLYIKILITGTHPITLLTITWADEGAALTDITGYGTNAVFATLYTDSGQSGFVTIEASMEAANGAIGDSNVNLFENEVDCCQGLSPTGGTAIRITTRGSMQRSRDDAPNDATWASARDTSPAKTISNTSSIVAGIGHFDADPDEFSCGRMGVSFYLHPDFYGAWGTTEFRDSGKLISIRTGSWTVVEGVETYLSLWTAPSHAYDFTAWTADEYNDYGVLASDFLCRVTYSQFDQSSGNIYWKLNDAGMDLAYTVLESSNGMLPLMIRQHSWDALDVEPEIGGGVMVKISPPSVGSSPGNIPYCPEEYPFFEGGPV